MLLQNLAVCLVIALTVYSQYHTSALDEASVRRLCQSVLYLFVFKFRTHSLTDIGILAPPSRTGAGLAAQRANVFGLIFFLFVLLALFYSLS